MNNKRRYRRMKRRLMVKFGERELSMTGFTVDLSVGGMFINSPQVLPLDTRLHIQLFVDPHQFFFFEADVRRQKLVPQELRSIERGGMGVRFLSPGKVVSEALGDDRRFEVRFATLDDLKVAYARDLRLGGVFVPSVKLLPRDSKVTVELCLDFAGKSFDFDATVVQTVDSGTGIKGLALSFDDRQAIAEELSPLVA